MKEHKGHIVLSGLDKIACRCNQLWNELPYDIIIVSSYIYRLLARVNICAYNHNVGYIPTVFILQFASNSKSIFSLPGSAVKGVTTGNHFAFSIDQLDHFLPNELARSYSQMLYKYTLQKF